ncbi:purine-cytosine permease family protein [Pseudonocardia acaciae]|uniref:purine-cytosine permease family protein n=1 Tax=Pseudonocardia acaciae TaxID=551276 RepID=UPI002481410F|nr:cytosine permease [Pseudonocardia acaciae]
MAIPPAQKTGFSDDYSLRVLPESEIKPTRDIALVRMGFTVSITDLVFGYTLGTYFSFTTAIVISFVYSAIVSLVSIPMGIIGVRERVSFALSSRFAFGTLGSKLPSLIMAAILTGFYGYVLGLIISILPHSDGSLGRLGYGIGLGVVFLVISGLGLHRGLRWIGRIGIPLMIVLVLLANIVVLVKVGGIGAIASARPQHAGEMTVAAMIGLGTAKWLAGAAITPDLLRFGKDGRAAVVTTLAEFLGGNFVFNVLGLVLGLGLGTTDLGAAFAVINLAWLAVLAFLAQSIAGQVNLLYAASLTVSNIANIRRTVTNVAVGVLGIAIAYLGLEQGILHSFLSFINYLGYALPAIPAIILADYFVVQRMHYPGGLDGLPAVNWRAIAAFVITVILNVILGVYFDDSLWHSLPLIGIGVYLLLSIRQLRG